MEKILPVLTYLAMRRKACVWHFLFLLNAYFSHILLVEPDQLKTSHLVFIWRDVLAVVCTIKSNVNIPSALKNPMQYPSQSVQKLNRTTTMLKNVPERNPTRPRAAGVWVVCSVFDLNTRGRSVLGVVWQGVIYSRRGCPLPPLSWN